MNSPRKHFGGFHLDLLVLGEDLALICTTDVIQ